MFQRQKSNEKREYNKKGYIYIYIYIYYLEKKYTMHDVPVIYPIPVYKHEKDGIYKSNI